MTTQPKSTFSRDLILAARHGLLPVNKRAWLGGFDNMLWKELQQWWGTKLWRTQTLIWVLSLNGVTTIVLISEAAGSPTQRLEEANATFLPMCMVAVSLGIIITVQGAIVGEKQLGTLAWIMSKPASRSGFILSKVLAYAIGFGVCAMLIPSVIFLIEVSLMFPGGISLAQFLAGFGLALVHNLFYIALTIMLGVLFNGRGPVAGIAIGLIIGGVVLQNFLPMTALILTPWPLQDLAGMLVNGSTLPNVWPVPVILTGIWTLIMLGVALWRFNRVEF